VGWTLDHYDPSDDTGSLLPSSSSSDDGSSSSAVVKRYASSPLPLYPSTTSLNYGTTVWEGLACRRSPASGRALLFRPDKNYERFARGARAMCLPVPPYELFMRGLQVVIQKNGHLIPPPPVVDPGTGVPRGGAKLYVRPMLLGSGQQLGLHVSPEISLLYYVSPTGSYFKGKVSGGLKLHLERRKCRASRGGTGNVKCSGNYAVAMRPLL
jgi:branched-chain amino acid aminotransferase